MSPRLRILLVVAVVTFAAFLSFGASSYDRNAAIAETLSSWAATNREYALRFEDFPDAAFAFEQRAQSFDAARQLVLTHP